MAKVYNHIKKQLKNSNYNPDLDTLTIRFTDDGIAKIGEPTWFDRIWHQMKENRARSIMPIFQTAPEFKASHAVIYKEPQGEVRYFDIETPLVKEGGRFVRFNPLLAYIDFDEEEKKKRLHGKW